MSLKRLTDDELLDRLDATREQERGTIADFINHLAEADLRDLGRKRGYQSTFDLCVKRFRMSEDEAIRRLRSARAVRLHPELLSPLEVGRINITNLSRVAAHLTAANVGQIIERIADRPTREVEKLVAEFKPERDRPDVIRSTARGHPGEALAAFPADRVKPSAPGRLHVSFTASEEFERLLERAKDLLWHKHPFGRLEDVLTEALREFVARRDPGLKPKPASERPPRAVETRRIPRWVRDRVWRRDGGRCAFVGPDGWRCEATRGLEFDHLRPWALGGSSDDPANVRLLCRGHNQLRARETFG